MDPLGILMKNFRKKISYLGCLRGVKSWKNGENSVKVPYKESVKCVISDFIKKLPEKNYSNSFLEYMWGGRNYFEEIFPCFRFSWTGKMPRIHQKFSNFSKCYWMGTFHGLKMMDWQKIFKKLDSLLLHTRIKAILAPEVTE